MTQSSHHATLSDLNHNYVRSVDQADVKWFDQHLAQDFMNINPDGSRLDRAGFLAQIGKPAVIRNLRCDDVNVRILGETAIIHARTHYTKPDGNPGGGRYTDIWMRQGGRAGRWLCVAAHVTRS